MGRRHSATKGNAEPSVVDPPPSSRSPPVKVADPPLRRSKRATAGQGGHAAQLERVGLAVENPGQPPKPQVILPNNEPVNLMAPTPRRSKKKPVQRGSSNTQNKVSSCNIMRNSILMIVTQGSTLPVNTQNEQPPAVAAALPQPTLVQAAPGSRFGFQLQAPPLPTFVGSQSVDAFERDRIRGKPSIASRATKGSAPTSTMDWAATPVHEPHNAGRSS